VKVEQFRAGGSLLGRLEGDIDGYRRYVLEGEFDVMMNYAAQQWATDAVFAVLDRIPYPKVMAPCGLSSLFDPNARHYFDALPAILRRYDHLVVHSRNCRDGDFLRRHGLEAVTALPVAAAEDEFGSPVQGRFRTKLGIPADVPLLLSVGSHTGLKGHRETIAAFSRARIGSAALVIVGNTVAWAGCLKSCRRRARAVTWTTLGRKKVALLDAPRRDVVDAFHDADLFVFPSNLECGPIVLAESMASATPFVSTPCGMALELVAASGAGIIVEGRTLPSGLMETSTKDVSRAIETLMADAPLRERMGRAGVEYWRANLTWEKIALEYERLCHGLVGGARDPTDRRIRSQTVLDGG
jgi:glycosyltransferase involved in cell wall biosynthesis